MTLAQVSLWKTQVGAVSWDAEREVGTFEYDPAFLRSGIELAPLHMPLRRGTFAFPALSSDTFKGLPGMLADALPDKFGTLLINAWLARQGRAPSSLNPVERLCYVGTRAMGALEFEPAVNPEHDDVDALLDVGELVALAEDALRQKASLDVLANEALDRRDLTQIIQVGTSAGGARAKAVIAWNEQTNAVRSGQHAAPAGFTHWLIKFDGVDGNRDRELNAPLGFGRVEQAYADMARAAGIEMPRTRLLEEGGRAHFMTERFDRPGSDRRHMQTLTAMAHFDFNQAGAYGYEQAFQVMRRLRLPKTDLAEQFRRAVFNVIARNQDDHTKNISFLMDRAGTWSLSPAYDITYAYNPSGAWTSQHQMTINGKRDNFTDGDLHALGSAAGLTETASRKILRTVVDAVDAWPDFAADAGVNSPWVADIRANHRLNLLPD